MRSTLRINLVIASISLFGLLVGCSSTSPNVVPSTGPDTLDVYQNHVAGIKTPPVASEGERQAAVGDKKTSPKTMRQVGHADRDLAGYTRDANNEISLTFPRLPNPELIIYVFPHMSPKGHPIPGYTTSIRMYEKDEYALPGEVAP
ncbi:MAG: TIGR03751 family conjugal transfer lipoprotein [Candidatus Thiodiazotropha endolucinida]